MTLSQIGGELRAGKVFFCLFFGVCFSAFVCAKQHSVAIFQFTATSMDVVGIENDVAYVVRSELRKNADFTLLNQREMETVLMRNRIIQGFDLQQALDAGQALDVNFVVMGTVSRVNGNINSQVALVSSANRQKIAEWNFNFLNQQDVLNRGKEMGAAIAAAIEGFVSVSAQNSQTGQQVHWLEGIKADVVEGLCRIHWTVATFAPESLGFNIYRGLSEQGPFSYVSSLLEQEYVDDISGLSGDVYYQVSLLTATGEEFRSKQLVKIHINPQIESSLAAPAVLSVTHLIKGIEIAFLPSAQNVGQGVDAYQLVRREKGQAWTEVNRISVDLVKLAKNKNAPIEQYTLIDANTSSFDGPVEYAVRAVQRDELGKTSEPIYHEPVNPPSLIDTGIYGVRQALIKWQPVDVGKGYKIYRREVDGNANWQLIATISDIRETRYVDDGFTAEDQSYVYAINVFDDYSSSSLGEPITLTSRGKLKAPSDFYIEDGLARKVVLHWQGFDDPALTGYAIFRAPFTEQTDITLQKIAEVLDPSQQTYTDQAIEVDGNSYYYAVAALNTFNSSGDLTPVLQGTSKAPPLPIVQLGVELESKAVKLSWSANANAGVNDFQYRIDRRWQQTTWHELTTVNGQTFVYSDEQLLPQATVEYRVSVLDVDKLVSPAVNSKPLKTLNNVLMLPQPDGLLRGVKLAWQRVFEAEKLHILRRQGNQEWRQIAELDGSTTSYQDTMGLFDGTQYEYRLAVIYGEQTVTYSDTISMKTKNIAAPSELSIVNGEAGIITLNWPANEDPDLKSYIVYRASKADNYREHLFLAEIPVTSPSTFTDSVESGSIEHGEVYRYAVASRNVFDAIGARGASVEGFSKKLPAAATELTISSVKGNIVLNWQAGSETDLQTTEIYRRWTHENQWVLLDKIRAENTEFQDNRLLPYATAEYKVRFVDVDALAGKDSMLVSLQSPVIVELKAESQGLLRKNILSWSNNGLVENYKVLRSENNISWQEIASTTQNGYVDVKNLLDEKRYFYKLLVLHRGQQIGESNTIEVSTKALPAPPLNFSAKSAQVKKVTLSWTPHIDPDVAGYIVYRLLENGKTDELAKLTLSDSEYLDEGGFFTKLEHGTQYEYLVSAFNRYKVEGPKSQAVKAITKALPAPVSGFLGQVTNNAVRLQWLANQENDISQYVLYRGKTCTRANKLISLSRNLTEFTDNSVEPGNDYCYYILAQDTDLLESATSEQVNLNLPNPGE